MPAPDRARPPSIVVGVDGSDRNAAAVRWATAEAVRTDRDLRLVVVASTSATEPQVWTEDSSLQLSPEEARALLESIRVRAEGSGARIAIQVATGAPSAALRTALVPGDLLVVGRRGVGGVESAVLGSTSIQVAGRASEPTVVVPDEWDAPGHDGDPLVAGVDWTERDGPVLDLAFERAAGLGVPLVVLGAWWVPRLNAWDADRAARDQKRAHAELAERLGPWTERHPDVDLDVRAPAGDPVAELLSAAAGAQLLVLGRYRRLRPLSGFSAFGTGRRVLHLADCPVMIAPVGRR